MVSSKAWSNAAVSPCVAVAADAPAHGAPTSARAKTNERTRADVMSWCPVADATILPPHAGKKKGGPKLRAAPGGCSEIEREGQLAVAGRLQEAFVAEQRIAVADARLVLLIHPHRLLPVEDVVYRQLGR